MKYSKVKAVIMFMAVGMSIFFSGCGDTKTAKNNSSEENAAAAGIYNGKVTLGATTWIGYAPLHLALEKGFFKDEGIDMDIRVIESAGDLKMAAKAGQIQGMAQTIDTEVMAKSSGLDINSVLPLCNSNGGDGIVAKKGYNTLADLKGKSIALDTTGGASLFWFNTMLDEQGLSMKDFDIKNMTAGDAGSAFVGGNVEAAVTWEPWLSKANATTFGKTLVSSKQYPGVIVDALAINSDFAKQYPKTIQGIIRAWLRAVQYAKDNPDDAIPIMAKSQNLTPEEFKAQLPNIEYFDKDMTNNYLLNGKMAEVAQKASDLWIKMKLTTNPIKGTDLVSDSYYKAAISNE
ncbi:ABC transporter substrate-binding protein [Pectinatus haikarae]|uniref:NitT/TauT family transport system substrate-binding protein n=1 Tax=Pectinatus haikarae TaxID=349096 RepID=A0ABT9YAB1_9FIRM|nr:ABC transporter substrate-binding protein [Pectinatus haikarae]MDQ0204785.1 NitT/TauT family transport system substrate-binding protein [Pectinatus haikarae]